MNNFTNATTTNTSFEADDETAQELAVEAGKRVGLMIFNDSANNLYCLIDGDATTSSYSFKLAPGAYYEMPKEYYTDKVTGIWDGTDGGAKVTVIKRA